MKKALKIYVWFVVAVAIAICASVIGENAGIITRKMTVNDVIRLSEKGEDLTFVDLRPYKHGDDVGCGLYILVYEINDTYELIVAGGSPDSEAPVYYAYLRNIKTEREIDITREDPRDFLKR